MDPLKKLALVQALIDIPQSIAKINNMLPSDWRIIYQDNYHKLHTSIRKAKKRAKKAASVNSVINSMMTGCAVRLGLAKLHLIMATPSPRKCMNGGVISTNIGRG